MAKVDYNINLDRMLERIPAGQERENAAISLDQFLGIPHIPTEGFEKSITSPAKQESENNSRIERKRVFIADGVSSEEA